MRSQLAEAFYNHMTKTYDATSAGAIATLDDRISHREKKVMDEIGIPTDDQYSKQLTPEMIDAADIVILFPTDFMPDYALAHPKARKRDVIDPHYHQEEGIELVYKVRDEIAQRVNHLVEELHD